MTKKENREADSLADLEAEDELFGEVIEREIEDDQAVEIMASHDLSESSAARASRMQIANRNSAHAGIEDEDRLAAASTRPETSSTNVAVTLAIVVVAALAALYVFTMGANDASKDGAVVEAPAAEGADTPAPAPVADEDRGDGTPTLDAKTLVKGIVASGWRVGDTSSDRMNEVVQTNLLAEKGPSAASVVIYESGTWEWADQLKLSTEPPMQAISFGRTIVRIGPGPQTKSNGVIELRAALEEFKTQAREKLAQP